MSALQRTTLSMTLSISGVKQEIEVEVSYLWLPIEYGMREPNTGIQLEPDYPAGIEITSVRAPQQVGKESVNIDWMLSEQVLQGITNEILGERQ